MEIDKLNESINSFAGNQKDITILKGDLAEFWHAATFNIYAAKNKSLNRAYVNKSNEFGSLDIVTNFGEEFGLKYYSNGIGSAKAQSISVFQRFKEYQAMGGQDNLEDSLKR